ncbi:MAG: hypothetical protein SF066_18460 [Thermoanaerobaculia bacterium]|nr:hypothetical protein [Thermoanaerobaculia bacterium]
MKIRFVSLALLAGLALVLAPAGFAAVKKAPKTEAPAQARFGSVGNDLFSFQCAIDCGDGRWYSAEVETLRECVEVCQVLCGTECWVAY